MYVTHLVANILPRAYTKPMTNPGISDKDEGVMPVRIAIYFGLARGLINTAGSGSVIDNAS